MKVVSVSGHHESRRTAIPKADIAPLQPLLPHTIGFKALRAEYTNESSVDHTHPIHLSERWIWP